MPFYSLFNQKRIEMRKKIDMEFEKNSFANKKSTKDLKTRTQVSNFKVNNYCFD